MGKQMSKKIGEERCEGMREMAIYRVEAFRQNAQGGVKHSEVRRGDIPTWGHSRILYKNRQTRKTVWG